MFYSGGQGVLIASGEPLRASRARCSALSGRPGIAAKLDPGGTLIDLMKYLLLTGDDLDRFLEDQALPAPPRRHVVRLGRGARHPLQLPRLAL
jgi:hypothetical protein